MRDWDATKDYGEAIPSGSAFPSDPVQNQKFIRTDFTPIRLYERRDSVWIRLYDNIPLTWQDKTLIGSDLTNDKTTTRINNNDIIGKQGLDKAISPQDEG